MAKEPVPKVFKGEISPCRLCLNTNTCEDCTYYNTVDRFSAGVDGYEIIERTKDEFFSIAHKLAVHALSANRKQLYKVELSIKCFACYYPLSSQTTVWTGESLSSLKPKEILNGVKDEHFAELKIEFRKEIGQYIVPQFTTSGILILKRIREEGKDDKYFVAMSWNDSKLRFRVVDCLRP